LRNFHKDLFICHASEDKNEVVRPLYKHLSSVGFNIWYDEAEIKWGDSITQKVNWGLIHSRYVIVVISQSFLKKNWPNREFNSVLNQESSTGEVRVLPLIVEHEANSVSPQSAYPLLSDKKYLVWEGSTQAIVEELRKLFPYKADDPYVKNQNPFEEAKSEHTLNRRFGRPTVLVHGTVIESLMGSQTLGTFIQPTVLKDYLFDEIISAIEGNGNDLFLIEGYLKVAIEKAEQILKNSSDGHRIFLQLSSTFFRYSNESKSILRSIIDATSLEPNRFTLLFSEAAILTDNIGKAVGLTAELKYEGFDIGINKFGTGYSNLSQLKSLSIDDLFIDRQFLSKKDMGTNHSIISAVMALCSGLEIRAVAEGVANDEQKMFLKTTGCKFIENLGTPSTIQ
jgi:EAL domain-containing protein (putative c-di-GMP-specific phosphodiesterase class I)